MLTNTDRFIAKHWPLICGLIIGGLLGAIMQSLTAFLLFGAIGWAYFHFDFFHAPHAPASSAPCDLGEHDDEGGPGFYMSKTEAHLHGAMFKAGGENDGAGFYL